MIVFLEGFEKLRADGRAHFIGHQLQPGGKGVAGLQAPGQQLQGVGELLLEFPQAAVLLEGQELEGKPDPQAAARQGPEEPPF